MNGQSSFGGEGMRFGEPSEKSATRIVASFGRCCQKQYVT
jgi:hypothetical protein